MPAQIATVWDLCPATVERPVLMPMTRVMGYRCAVVMHDTFLSGWGLAEGGRSFYVLLCDTEAEAHCVGLNAGWHGSMRDAKITHNIVPASVASDLTAQDHVRIATRLEAPRWFIPGAFK